MNKAYTVVEGLEEFRAAREQLEVLIRWLQVDAFNGLDHGEIEAHIDQSGREILRQLLQGHLSLRAQREERQAEVSGSEDAHHVQRANFSVDTAQADLNAAS